jgi:long-chain acyl-CoA synthetase
MNEKTLPELLRRRIALTPAAEAYRQFDAASGRWVGHSWADVGQRVSEYKRALGAEGLPAGARVGVLVANSIEHVCVDQAALALGFVPVPLHVIDNPESLAYVLADCGASLLFVGSAARWQLLEPFRTRLPALRRVIHLDASPGADLAALRDARGGAAGMVRSLAEWLAGAPGSGGGASDAAPDADALAAIVYTSGTTGRPKGVMLSHRNVVSDIQSILSAIPVLETDVFLSFLPLSHTLERTVGYYVPIAAGACVVFARSVSRLMDDFAAVRPTVLVSVPRIYERVYAGIRESMEHRAAGRALLALAIRAGWARFARTPRFPASLLLQRLDPQLDRWVGARVRARFGGRLRAAVTGGAPMPSEVARTFLALGVPLLQGYGLTESAPVVSCNTLEDNQPETVGRPLPGVEVRIGEHDELLVRGPNVMVGYWERPGDTAEAIDREGWLHTGDQAQIVEGRIIIKGRIKDIIVTSTGEKIPPVDVETAIVADGAFDQVMVVGEGRPYIVALCVLNPLRWEEEARKLGLEPRDFESLRSPAAREWGLSRIAEAVRGLPAYARPRAVYLTTEPWTIDAGLITPTLKPKRPALESRFAEAIGELYRGHAIRN